MTGLLRVADRNYEPLSDSDDEVLGSEIQYLRRWEDGLPPRAMLVATLQRAFGDAVTDDDSVVELDLKVSVGDVEVATVYVFLSESGLEISGWAMDDLETDILPDLTTFLGVPPV